MNGPNEGAIDVTADFDGDVLGPVPIDEAAGRILAYCTSRSSGWAVYDLASISARRAGLLDEVAAWSLLFANALNGRVDVKQLSYFDQSLRRGFASLIGRIPANLDLHNMNNDELSSVIDACCFGFKGAWAPKITKLGALYRPRAIPVLDGYVSMAFGYRSDDLSTVALRFGRGRRERISAIVHALAVYLHDHQGVMARLRTIIAPTVPELATAEAEVGLPLISDLRLLDMVMWTAIDDRLATRAGEPPRWLGRSIGSHISPAELAPEPIPSNCPASETPAHRGGR